MGVVAFEAPANAVYGQSRVEREAAGTTVGGSGKGLLIAAQALALDMIVVTANQREFARVGGLRVETWST